MSGEESQKMEILKLTISSINTISFTVSMSEVKDASMIRIVNTDNRNVPIKSLTKPDDKHHDYVITLNDNLDLTKGYDVTITGFGTKTAIPNEVFDSEYFINNFTYDGNDLGSTITDKGTMFKVWCPTASCVLLQLFKSGTDEKPYSILMMNKGDKGVWSYEVEGVGHGTYYTYIVKCAGDWQEAVDPYAKSAGLNGIRGMVLDQKQASPQDFDKEEFKKLDSYHKAVVWETHVRDFSNEIKDCKYKGKYLSFTETGLKNENGIPVGIDYLKELGITHVQLMPVYDFGSVDETDSTQFNWGYDPQNYNVPEGSYSTDPSNGSVRVVEFKQMIQALHANNFSVVMDVVYNHTQKENSNLNRCVPYYYYRYQDDNKISNGSGCGNDTMSERVMCSKYFVDSLHYWMETYKLDGFRFDLMGLIDLKTIQKVEEDIHKLNPSAIIYGEGWQMGTATKVPMANQANIIQVKTTNNAAGAVGVFNDAIRDGIRGSVFNKDQPGYLGNPANNESVNKVIFGLKGSEVPVDGVSWKVENACVINYISAHDNSTLYDKLKSSCSNLPEDKIFRMNKNAAAIVMLCKGIPFMLGGEEMLRSKVNDDGSFNDNSFNASDKVNNMKWNTLSNDSNQYKTFLYYKGLIQLRKETNVLTSNNENVDVQRNGNCLVAIFDDKTNQKVVAVINPNDGNFDYTLPDGNWSLIANGETAGVNEISAASGKVSVDPQAVFIYREKTGN